MTSINFKARFVPAILAGEKRQTIRPERKSPARFADKGEQFAITTGARTPDYRVVASAICKHNQPVSLYFGDAPSFDVGGRLWVRDAELEKFAKADGFNGWGELEKFFREVHGPGDFSGRLVTWHELKPASE